MQPTNLRLAVGLLQKQQQIERAFQPHLWSNLFGSSDVVIVEVK